MSGPDDFDARLAALQQERARETGADRAKPTGSGRLPGMGQGLRMGVELVAGLAVGLGIGYLADRWLGTGPWLMVLGFFLGAASGMLNVWRVAKGMGDGIGFQRLNKSGVASAAPADGGRGTTDRRE